MWQNVANSMAAFFEVTFPLHRQRQLTLLVLFAIVALGIVLLTTIVWADVFYA